MRSILSSLLLTFVLAVSGLSTAHAHFEGECALVLNADAENLEVMVSIALPAAATLLPGHAAPLSSATLDTHRPALLAAASRVCTLLDANGAPLKPDRVLVSVFEDHELRVHFLFPPDARPARLRLPFLASVRNGFCNVTDARMEKPSHAVLTTAAIEHILAPEIAR